MIRDFRRALVATGKKHYIAAPPRSGAMLRKDKPLSDRRPICAIILAMVAMACGPRMPAQAQAGLDQLDATRSRPLFVPTRRPPPVHVAIPQDVAAMPVAPAAPPMPSLQLNGVIVGPDRTFAVVRRLADAKLLSLEVGRDVDGWSVAAIRSREVDLRRGDTLATIRLPTR